MASYDAYAAKGTLVNPDGSPNAAASAYASAAWLIRDLAPVARLAGPQGIAGYRFREPAGDRELLVLWSTGEDAPEAVLPATEPVQAIDQFGNALPPAAPLRVGAAPVFLPGGLERLPGLHAEPLP
jgi:hypothetical protein